MQLGYVHHIRQILHPVNTFISEYGKGSGKKLGSNDKVFAETNDNFEGLEHLYILEGKQNVGLIDSKYKINLTRENIFSFHSQVITIQPSYLHLERSELQKTNIPILNSFE